MLIYKYEIPMRDRFEIEMPIESKILSFQCQNGNMALWAAVHPSSSLETRIFKLLGTGSYIDIEEVNNFIGTVQQLNGNLVWHLFEIK